MPRERSRGRRRSGVLALNRGSSPHVRRSSLPLNTEGGSSFFAGRPASGGGRDAVAEALMFPLASVQGSFEEGLQLAVAAAAEVAFYGAYAAVPASYVARSTHHRESFLSAVAEIPLSAVPVDARRL